MTDIAILAVPADKGICDADEDLLELFSEKDIPFVVAVTKADLREQSVRCPGAEQNTAPGTAPDTTSDITLSQAVRRIKGGQIRVIETSALTGHGIAELKEALGEMAKNAGPARPLISDLAGRGDIVVLVVPIDKSAPKGRLILPQQMVIRALLDAGAIPVITRDSEYPALIGSRTDLPGGHISVSGRCPAKEENAPGTLSKKPALVVTDSQVFGIVADRTPEDMPLTSFSILMARYKGTLDASVRGAKALRGLKDGDTVLIAEGCTHHRQCEDIGTVKFPKWIEEYTGAKIRFEFTSGNDFPEDLSGYSLILHCGGCMLNEKEMRSRSRRAKDSEVPMTNYGVAIAEMNGILDRALKGAGLPGYST